MTNVVKPAFTERETHVVHTAVRKANVYPSNTRARAEMLSFSAFDLNHISGWEFGRFSHEGLVLLAGILEQRIQDFEKRIYDFEELVVEKGTQGLSDVTWGWHGTMVDYDHLTRDNFCWHGVDVTLEYESLLEDMVSLRTAYAKVSLLLAVDSAQRERDAMAFNEGR